MDKFDVLVELKKIGGQSGNPQNGGVPIGRLNRGFLAQDCLDTKGNLKIGERINVSSGLYTSELQEIASTEKPHIFILQTKTGMYEMKIIRKTRFRRSI